MHKTEKRNDEPTDTKTFNMRKPQYGGKMYET